MEAYESLEATAASWLEGAIESGLPIPEPEMESDYSGRVVLRMPKSTHRRAAEAAERDRVSLNTFLVAAVSERLGQAQLRREVAALRNELRSALQTPFHFAGVAYYAPTAERTEVHNYQVLGGAGTVAVGGAILEHLAMQQVLATHGVPVPSLIQEPRGDR